MARAGAHLGDRTAAVEIEILEFPDADEAIAATCPWYGRNDGLFWRSKKNL